MKSLTEGMEDRENQNLATAAETETTALLTTRGDLDGNSDSKSRYEYGASESSSRVTVYSGDESQSSRVREAEPGLFDKTRRSAKKLFRVAFLMLLAAGATFVAIAAFSARSINPLDANMLDVSIPSLRLSNFVFAPDVVSSNTTTTTFQELASAMLPTWYDTMIGQLDKLTPTVQPDQVYKARKIILKTRDLLDVFSPAYPNTTHNNTTMDLWERIRHYVSHLYMTVGEFQDLHNAHVRFSEKEMEIKRALVLLWKDNFTIFRQEHAEIPTFLAAPTGYRYAHKESHLFWQTVEEPPFGRDPATPSLQKLGKGQLERALTYLHQALPYQFIMNETVHAIYHNLRKELRSITDEFDLFQWVMFPIFKPCCTWADTFASVNVLKTARTLLGDINDDWTAYSIYVENDEYHVEQERLRNRIESGWSGFKLWVKDVDLDGVLGYLSEVMEVNATDAESPPSLSTSLMDTELETDGANVPDAPIHRSTVASSQSSTISLLEFLRERKRQPTQQLVIGNEAGDADTVISAISLAYIESMQQGQQKTPIVAIPEADLETQRPEVTLLFELAGILHPTKVLIFVDDPLIEDDSSGAQLTLVDHNMLTESFETKNWTVVEIVDHHEDHGQYLNTCSGNARNIAFADGRALVASACTLVAERLRQHWTPPYPASLGLLLLGVILLDSVNLSERVGKVTQRDIDAVADLLLNTDWDALPAESRTALRLPPSVYASPDLSLLFKTLQDAKYDSRFWSSLSVRDSLRLDYKEYPYNDETMLFGISTVLMPMDDFLTKKQLIPGILRYMEEVGVDFLGIMFAFQNVHGRLYRQLAICGTKNVPLDDIAAFLLRPDHSQGSLDLEEVQETNFHSGDGLRMRFFDQCNVEPSRKQIGPILMDFFESTNQNTDIGDAFG